MARFLTGCVLSFGLLWLLGIIRARWLSQKAWVILWTLYSLSLAAFIVLGFLAGHQGLVNWALGAALGYVVAVGWHTLHHALEEMGGVKHSLHNRESDEIRRGDYDQNGESGSRA